MSELYRYLEWSGMWRVAIVFYWLGLMVGLMLLKP